MRRLRQLHILLLCLVTHTVAAQQPYTYEDKLLEAYNYILEHHIDTVNRARLVDAAIAGMFNALDPHSNYWDERTSPYIKRTLENEYTGYGLSMSLIDDTLTVTGVECDGPGDKAGIEVGDVILAIADRPTSGVGITMKRVLEIVSEQRYFASFNVRRSGEDRTRLIKVQRGKVERRMISDALLLSDNTAIIRITQFGRETGAEFKAALKKLKKSGAESLIIDLRDNSGGYIASVREIMSLLIAPQTPIYATIDRTGTETWTTTSDDKPIFSGRVVILANANSASASELLMAIVQDLDRGIVVGRPTFGKGLVQEQHPFPDNSSLNLSTHRWISPSRRSIQRNFHVSRKEYFDRADRVLRNPQQAFDNEPSTADFRSKVFNRRMTNENGIRPDIFVHLDTTDQNFILSAMLNKGLEAIVVSKVFQSTQGAAQTITNDALAERIRFEASKKGIATTKDQILQSPLIMEHFRAAIAKKDNCKLSIMQSTIPYDRDVLRALQALRNDGKEYDDALRQNDR